MSFHMKNAYARRAFKAAAISLFALMASVAHADWGGLNMTEGVTILSKEIYGLHMTIYYWCIGIGVVVFGVMIYSLVKFRKSQGAKPDTTLVHSTKVEIIWTVIPIMILVAMAVPTAKTLIKIEDMGNVGAQHQGHGLPVEVGIRIPEPGRELLLDAQGRQQRSAPARLGHRPEPRSLTICSTWTTRWSSRRAPRSASCSPRRT